ncbi:hypothetical protein ACIGZJ_04875 [Kitasatospora sp. NPDC052868]|uniref:hypothetical protein n=1 Tax=Kitasatospora sp. NPDC052868 TaxID=3364060 RepID=UPI0037C5601C
MPFADTSLRDEYAAAVERVAGRTLDALRGAGGAVTLAEPGSDPATAHPLRPLLAAVRVLGPDMFAPQLFGGAAPDEQTAWLVAEAHEVFPSPAPPPPPWSSGVGDPDGDPDRDPDGPALIAAWRDWATGILLTRSVHSVTAGGLPAPGVTAPQPDHAPQPQPHAWQAWSVRMAQLSALALPGLHGPVQETALAHPTELARGVVRSMLRRDHRVAARLARWLAWAQAQGQTLPLEIEPVLERIHVVGDGSARTALELAIAEALLGTAVDGGQS